MNEIVITHVIKPSSELLMVMHELTAALSEAARAVQRSREYQGAGDVKIAQDDAAPSREATKAQDGPPEPIREAKDQDADLARPPASIHKAPVPEPAGRSAPTQGGIGMIEPQAPKPAATDHPPEMVQPPIAAGTHPRADWNPAWATPERRAALIKMYGANVRLPVIKEELEKLPGSHLPSPASIQNFATQVLHARRDPSLATFTRSPPVPPPDPELLRIRANSANFAKAMTLPKKETLDTSAPIPVDFGTARAKAASWGLEFRTWSDLALLNEKAHRIGHRLFCQEPTGRLA